jgi:phage gp36-like protein
VAYCTLQQLTDRYGVALLVEVSDRAGGSAPVAPDDALFDRAIADADSLIDSYLKARYALPLAETPRLVTDLSLRISIYFAHARVADEKIRKDYDDAIRTLAAIATGAIRLDVAGVEPASSGAGEVLTNEPHRPLSADTMKGYI